MINKLSIRLLIILITCLAAFQFGRIDFSVSHPEKQIDFRNVYVGAKLWAESSNPYLNDQFQKKWLEIAQKEQLSEGLHIGAPNMPLLYFPNALMFYTPFAWINYSTAAVLNLYLSLGLLLIICFIIAQYVRKSMGVSNPLIIPFFIFLLFLSLKPTVNSINVGQPMWYAFAFLMLGVYLLENNKNQLIGIIFLSLGALKPTLALPFYVWLLWKGQLKNALFSSILSLIWLGVSIILPVYLNPQLSVSQILGNLKLLIVNYQQYISDPTTPHYPFTFEALSNCSWQFFSVYHPLIPRCINLVGLAVLFFCYYNYKKHSLARFQPLFSAIIFFYFLGAVHHKYYDSLILIFPFSMVILEAKNAILKGAFIIWICWMWVPLNALEKILNLKIPEEYQMTNTWTILLGFLLCLYSLLQDQFKVRH